MTSANRLQTGDELMITARSTRRKLGALCFAVAGLAFIVVGMLHPHVDGPTDYNVVIATMLQAPIWVAAHKTATATGLLLATALWLLIDVDFGRESIWSDGGSRLALVATLFMTVDFSVEAAAKSSTALLALVDQMQSVGWPAFGLGYALVAAGAKNAAPLAVRCIGAAGALAMGLAGLLVVGLHILYLEPLFAGGFFLGLWMMWAGVRTARSMSAQNAEALEVN
jgi:hypothetical protein